MSLSRVTASLFLLFAYPASSWAANLPVADADGWFSWRVAVVDSAPELCCFSWNNDAATKKRCNLDGRHGGFNTTDSNPFPADEVQIYTLMRSGTATKIRALSSQCPVTSDAKIAYLGSVDVDESVAWLRRYVSAGSSVSTEAIATVAMHAGNGALKFLLDTATSDDNDEHREDAIFWMAQLRIDETADDIQNIMFGDSSADIRVHAAFSYSQSVATDRAEVLIRQGKGDPDGDVRSQAWFWLTQIEAAESEIEIRKAIVNERDAEVREQAVFALSQLPGERAARALAGVLEDRQLDLDVREQALFSLAQTESDAAFEYIERLLTEN